MVCRVLGLSVVREPEVVVISLGGSRAAQFL
jgi:hypothetical protein